VSIRIRVVDGVTVALCAARSIAKAGDVYLDDAQHLALAIKFAGDFVSSGQMPEESQAHAALRAREESDNANRDWWERTYGVADDVILDVQPGDDLSTGDMLMKEP
jgi:hypothetical protein